MSEYNSEDILTCALTGHGTVGKTILADTMLYNAGIINRIGSIESGSTTSDYRDDEITRQISISTSVLNFPWDDKKINLLDSPGYADFFGETQGALRVSDFSLVVINAVAGIEVGTEQVWKAAADYSIPRLLVVNMLDREHVKFDDVLAMARERFGNRVFPLGLPANPGPNFNQIADILRNELHTYQTDGTGKYGSGALPDDWSERVKTLHGELVEAVAESDDTLLEKFFEQDSLTEEDLRGGLRGAILAGTLIPIFPISGLKNVGVRRMMDVMARYAPCAADTTEIIGTADVDSDKEVTLPATKDGNISALIFKTVSEAHLGELSFFRVCSGTVKMGADLFNSNQ
ncbi:MAG: GTP-binding protein, partial [Candidatus Neomarinimicrobiota bacterium]